MCEGAFATCRSLEGRRAYVKPQKDLGDHPVAAREKIASDLAYELGVPVPPFILTPSLRGAGAPVGWLPTGASLVLHVGAAPWRAVEPGRGFVPISQGAIARIQHSASRVFAFDLWLGQLDHGSTGPAQNPLVGKVEGAYQEIVALDYEKSMETRDTALRMPPFPAGLARALIAGELYGVVSGIVALPRDIIEDIVRRIPGTYLRPERASETLELLLSKRPHLDSFLRENLK